MKGLEHRRGTVRDTSSFVSPETAVTRRTMLIGEKRSPTRQVSLHTLLGKQPRLLARETASAGHCGGHCHQSPFQAGLWSTSVPFGHHAPLTRGKFTVLRRGSQHRGTNKSFDNKAVSGSRKAKTGRHPTSALSNNSDYPKQWPCASAHARPATSPLLARHGRTEAEMPSTKIRERGRKKGMAQDRDLTDLRPEKGLREKPTQDATCQNQRTEPGGRARGKDPQVRSGLP